MTSTTRLLSMIAITSLGAGLAAACGGDDERPPGLSTGGGAGVGPGGAGGMGGSAATGGSAGSGGSGGSAVPAECKNKVKDPGETDVDCGGPCPPCEAGQICGGNTDCKSGVCDDMAKECLTATCSDTVKNNNETDVDCGGPNCNKCDTDANCEEASDCIHGVCSGDPLICQEPLCDDGVRNGKESDIDCGIGCATACSQGQRCNEDLDCASKVCDNNTKQCRCPDTMIVAPILNAGGGSYCIDQGEVSNEKYNAFLNAGVDVNTQEAKCAFNDTFTPEDHWPYGVNTKDRPVRSVDWCDAYAYCQWAGKRLCGKVDGGPSAFGDSADEATNQWFSACSAHGQNTYPYGDNYNRKSCHGSDDDESPFDPLFLPGPENAVYEDSQYNTCNGGWFSLLNMAGNVREWEDSCDGDTDENDLCHARGGSYADSGDDLKCIATTPLARDTRDSFTGFRCCAD